MFFIHITVLPEQPPYPLIVRMVGMDGWYGSNRTVIPLLSFVYFEISMLLHGLTISLTDSEKEPCNKTH